MLKISAFYLEKQKSFVPKKNMQHVTNWDFKKPNFWFSEWAQWAEILLGFMKFYFKQMLKISAFYLESQKKIFWVVVSKYAKRDPKDGVCCPNFQWRFWVSLSIQRSTVEFVVLDLGQEPVCCYILV